MCRPIVQIYGECGCSHLVGKKYCSWRKQHGAAVPYWLVDEEFVLEAWCLVEDADLDKPLEIRDNGRCPRCEQIAQQWVLV